MKKYKRKTGVSTYLLLVYFAFCASMLFFHYNQGELFWSVMWTVNATFTGLGVFYFWLSDNKDNESEVSDE